MKIDKKFKNTVVEVSLLNRNTDYVKNAKKIKLIFNIFSIVVLVKLLSRISILSLVLGIVLIIVTVYMNKFLKKVENFLRKKYLLRDQLLFLIQTNNLFTEKYETYVERNNQGREVEKNMTKMITNSASFSYFETSDQIIIKAYKVGDNFTKRLVELDVELSALLGLELENKLDTASYTKYSFLKKIKTVEQLTFSAQTFNKSVFKKLPKDTIALNNNQKFSLKQNTNLGLYGRTGSGKTVAIQWYLYNAIYKGSGTDSKCLLSLIDGKGADLFALGTILKEELDGNISIGQTPIELAKVSREFVEAMDERFEIIQKSDALNADAYDLGMTPSFLFIDELASIKDSCGSEKKGRDLWTEIMRNLGLIARKGRQAACHLCLSTQDPNAENIPSELRLQITSILFLQKPSTDRLKMAFSMCELENVPIVSGRKGEGLFYADGREQIEPEITIVPFVDIKTKEDFRRIINNIKPKKNNII